METTNSELGSPRLESLPLWTWITLLGICLLVFIIISVANNNDKPQKNTDPEKNDNSSTPQKYEYGWVKSDSLTINFTSVYQNIISIAKGKGLSFENSSEPYCVKNKSGEFCGEKGEDISSQLPEGAQNTELQFRSSNGKNGTVKIVIWVYQKKK